MPPLEYLNVPHESRLCKSTYIPSSFINSLSILILYRYGNTVLVQRFLKHLEKFFDVFLVNGT